jgi:hypothetical protein
MRLNEKYTILLFSFLQNEPLLKLLALVLAVGVLVTTLNNAYAELLGYSKSQITIGERQIYCTQDKIEAELVVKDLDGNVITQTAAGSEVSMEATLNLDCNISDNPLMMLFEVRDSDGMTKYLTYQQMPVHSMRQVVTSSSWVTDKPGEYEVRFFHITCLACPMVLASVEQYKITVY